MFHIWILQVIPCNDFFHHKLQHLSHLLQPKLSCICETGVGEANAFAHNSCSKWKTSELFRCWQTVWLMQKLPASQPHHIACHMLKQNTAKVGSGSSATCNPAAFVCATLLIHRQRRRQQFALLAKCCTGPARCWPWGSVRCKKKPVWHFFFLFCVCF